MDVTLLLLHADDVWRVIGFILIHLVLVEREEAELEEVLDDDSDLELKKNRLFKKKKICYEDSVIEQTSV